MKMYRLISKKLSRFLVADDGPTAVEYAVMLSMIAGACVIAVNQLSTAAKDSFNSSGTAINGAMNP